MDEPIQLVSMRQLEEARCQDDDWTGLRSQAERRKRQTRLSLRAHRKRKAALKVTKEDDAKVVTLTSLPDSSTPYSGKNTSQPTKLFSPHVDSGVLSIPQAITIQGYAIPTKRLYPISRDHLLPLIEFDLWRGILTNILITSHLHFVKRPSCRYLVDLPFPNPYAGSGSSSLPKSLQPTALQQRTEYPDWIDLLPSPQMRDNAVRTHHTFSNLDLCADLLGGLNGLVSSSGEDMGARMLVWSNPWEAAGWELTEGFVRRCWFLVDGCDDLLQATDHWRSLRGDEPLVVGNHR